MDLHSAFVSSLIAGGVPAFKYAIEKGINVDMLEGEGKAAFEYVIDHLKKYPSHFPSMELIEGKTGIVLPQPEGTHEFFVDEVINVRLATVLKGGMVEALKELDARNPQEALTKLQILVNKIRNDRLGSTPATSMFAEIPRVLEIYEMMKSGKKGIPLPFPSLNATTLGIWPQDLILFVARLGVGKTWTLLLCAKAAWEAGHRVLVVTTEMSKVRMAQRFLAMQQRLQYGDFRRGTMNAFAEQKMYENMAKLVQEDDGRLAVIGGDFDFRIENLITEVENFKPELVVVDGAYLLKTEGHNRTEQAANAFNGLKRLANRTGVGVIVTSQFNRDVDKNNTKTADVSNIGLTDVAGWNADVIYGLVQTEEMVHDKRMTYKPLKIREGKGNDFEVIWDIDNMHFEELADGPIEAFVENPGAGSSGPTEPVFEGGGNDGYDF